MIKKIIHTFLHNPMPEQVQQQFRTWCLNKERAGEKTDALWKEWERLDPASVLPADEKGLPPQARPAAPRNDASGRPETGTVQHHPPHGRRCGRNRPAGDVRRILRRETSLGRHHDMAGDRRKQQRPLHAARRLGGMAQRRLPAGLLRPLHGFGQPRGPARRRSLLRRETRHAAPLRGGDGQTPGQGSRHALHGQPYAGVQHGGGDAPFGQSRGVGLPRRPVGRPHPGPELLLRRRFGRGRRAQRRGQQLLQAGRATRSSSTT